MKMKHHWFLAGLTALVVVGCAEPAPPEIVNRTPTYQDMISKAEGLLVTGSGVGVIYIHPLRKRACNTVKVRVSRKTYNGIEHSWVVDQVAEAKERRNAPEGRRQIGKHPLFFEMPQEGTYRVDAISCEAYDKTVTTQYHTSAEFESAPARVAYIGDFTQNRLADGVDIYVPERNLTTAAERIGIESKVLQTLFVTPDVEYMSFENFDGTQVNAQEIVDNKKNSGDYFTLSQTLKSQSEDALLPFLGYLPDLVLPINGKNAKANTKDALDASLDLALLRLDLEADFHNILAAGKSFSVARNYLHNRLAVVNTLQGQRRAGTYINDQSLEANRQYKIATQGYDDYVSQHRLKSIVENDISDARENARAAWKTEVGRLSFVMVSQFSHQSDLLLRDRVQGIMDDYIPAKYASLKLEFATLAETRNLSAAETRQLNRLLTSTQTDEQIVLNELINEFQRENLSENPIYHGALNSLKGNWAQIFGILDINQ